MSAISSALGGVFGVLDAITERAGSRGPIVPRIASMVASAALLPFIAVRTLVFWYSPTHERLTGSSESPAGSFVSRNGDVLIYTRSWRTLAAQRKGVVFVVHGFGEHINRYGPLVETLLKAGYDVFGIDHQGHGQSGGDRAYVRKWTHLRDDFLDFIDRTLSEEAEKPRSVFLFGHSMGGGLAIEIARSCRARLNGVILSAPLVLPDPDLATPLLVRLSGVLSSWLPKMPITKLDAKFVSRNPDVVDDYIRDPLVYHGGIRTRVGFELLHMMEDIRSNAHSDTFPVLLLHGTVDRLTQPQGSELYLEISGAKDKKLIRYDGFYHELIHEPEGQTVLKDILTWIESHR